MPKVIHELSISLLDNGQVTMRGPLHDKILAYGLLQIAMDVVRETKAPEQTKLIQPALVIPSKVG